MSYAPALPITGYAGWVFLQRTMEKQTAAFNAQTSIKREEAYFREKIGSIDTAEQLVNDPRLLRVALTAFGLESDAPNKFFIRKVLEGGTLTTDALANKLANKQYQKFAAAFGFGNFAIPKTKLSDFADKILAPYKSQGFATAVGEQNNELRLALNLEAELPALAASNIGETAKWYTILGNPPLRTVFEQSFGLPTAFGALDIDRQVEILKTRSAATFGNDSVSQFSDPEMMDKLVKQFLIRSELTAGISYLSSGQVALTLLQNAAYR